jgi:hypothetical protein
MSNHEEEKSGYVWRPSWEAPKPREVSAEEWQRMARPAYEHIARIMANMRKEKGKPQYGHADYLVDFLTTDEYVEFKPDSWLDQVLKDMYYLKIKMPQCINVHGEAIDRLKKLPDGMVVAQLERECKTWEGVDEKEGAYFLLGPDEVVTYMSYFKEGLVREIEEHQYHLDRLTREGEDFMEGMTGFNAAGGGC